MSSRTRATEAYEALPVQVTDEMVAELMSSLNVRIDVWTNGDGASLYEDDVRDALEAALKGGA